VDARDKPGHDELNAEAGDCDHATTYSEIFDETIFTSARLNITGHGGVYLT
jgi:hypothetical protein